MSNKIMLSPISFLAPGLGFTLTTIADLIATSIELFCTTSTVGVEVGQSGCTGAITITFSITSRSRANYNSTWFVITATN